MNQFQDLFDRQKRDFATGMTRSHGWRIEQLDRMSRLMAENEAELQKAIAEDFKTASQEQIFETHACLGEVAFQKSQLDEWMKPVEAPVPRALAATGHRGVVYRDPYGVALIIGPFNGPLTVALAAGDHGAGGRQLLCSQAQHGARGNVLVADGPRAEVFRAGRCRGGSGPSRRDDRASEASLRLHLLHRQHQHRKGCGAGGRRESDAGPPRTRRPESCPGRRDRQHQGRREEDRLGRDGMGRPMVHVSWLCLCARVHCRRSSSPRRRRR